MTEPTTETDGETLQRQPLEFHGNGSEYFKIWIVNIFLTLVTLGIFSAWAKVRRLQYFYGNLSLGDHHFAYLADPVQILKGRLIAFSALVLFSVGWNFFPATAMILLAVGTLLIPAILVASWRFRMRYSSYRNITFDFPCSFATAYRVFVTPLVMFLAITGLLYGLLYLVDPATLTLFATGGETENLPEDFRVRPEDFLFTVAYLVALPFLPYLDCLRVRLLVNHTRYGNLPAQIKIGAGGFYRVYIVASLLMGAIFTLVLLAMIAIGFVIGLLLGEAGEAIAPAGIFIGVLIAYMALLYSGGYFRAERTNLIYDRIHFDRARLRSALRFHPVGMLYLTNTLAIIATAGLFTPWAQIRMTRYIASVTALEAGDLNQVLAASHANQDSVGEGMIDAFDLDLGL